MSTDTPFGNPDEHAHEHDEGAHQAPKITTYLTVDDVLGSARLVERTASICLRADLTAEHDTTLAELSTLVSPTGEVLEDDKEASAGETSNESRARELIEKLEHIKAEMSASMWHVRFRALPSDEWSTFRKLWWPKGKDPDLTEFRTKIIAECAIEPPITEAQARALRKKLSSAQIVSLSDTAYDACTTGGLDVPKSPNSWAGLKQQ